MQNDWARHYENTRHLGPSWLLVRTLGELYSDELHSALDVGSGALRDSRYLLNQCVGHVTALDKEAPPADLLASMPADRFTFVRSAFEDHTFPIGRFDLVNAQYSLPFTPPASFPLVWKGLLDSLSKNGIFVGQLFGDRDVWNVPDAPMTFHTEAEARAACDGLKILFWRESDRDGKLADGSPKRWHAFDIIAQKP